MPRRAAASIRPIEPDPVLRSRLVQQVINKVMLDGKKSTAERIVYDALATLSEKTGGDPVEQLEKSVRDAKLGVAAQEPASGEQAAIAPPAAPADPYEELGKRIAALIETADTEAKRLVEEAKAESSRMLQQGRSEADRIRLDAQVGRGVGLRIKIQDADPPAALRQSRGQVDSGGRLADAAFLIDDRDPSHGRSSAW